MKKADELSEKEKNAFAAFLLEELEDQERWDTLIEHSKGKLASMAEDALREYKSGDTKEMDTNRLRNLTQLSNFGKVIIIMHSPKIFAKKPEMPGLFLKTILAIPV